jgi:hypothetical protein
MFTAYIVSEYYYCNSIFLILFNWVLHENVTIKILISVWSIAHQCQSQWAILCANAVTPNQSMYVGHIGRKLHNDVFIHVSTFSLLAKKPALQVAMVLPVDPPLISWNTPTPIPHQLFMEIDFCSRNPFHPIDQFNFD